MTPGERHLANCVVVVDDKDEFRCSTVILHRRSAVFREMLSADFVSNDGKPRLPVPSNGFSQAAIRDALVALHAGTYPEDLEARMALLGPMDMWAAELTPDDVSQISEGLDFFNNDHVLLIKNMPPAMRRVIIGTETMETQTKRFTGGDITLKTRLEGLVKLWNIASTDPAWGAKLIAATANVVSASNARLYLEEVKGVADDVTLTFLGRVMVEHQLRSITNKRKREEAEREKNQRAAQQANQHQQQPANGVDAE